MKNGGRTERDVRDGHGEGTAQDAATREAETRRGREALLLAILLD
ncbi:hypothetical protein ABT300_22830 [Streptomyces sp. NPDC001027]